MEYATWKNIGCPWVLDGWIVGECRFPERRRRYDAELAAQRLRLAVDEAMPRDRIEELRDILRRADEALARERRTTTVGGETGDLEAARKAADDAETWARRKILERNSAENSASLRPIDSGVFSSFELFLKLCNAC